LASTFTNAKTNITVGGNTPVTVYTTPASTQAILHNVSIGNIDGVNSTTVTVIVGGTTILKDAPLPIANSLFIDKPLNLQSSESITVGAADANRASVFISVLEIT